MHTKIGYWIDWKDFISSLDMSTKISTSSFAIEIWDHDYVFNLCKQASAKISAMARVCIYAFKSKETSNESHIDVSIWLMSASMDESQQKLK